MVRPAFTPVRLAAAAAAALLVATGSARAETLTCEAPGLRLIVDVDAPSGRCSVDGRSADMKRAHNPVVCHVSNPQLRILTIGSDGGFIWEDTASDRVVRGTCIRA